MAKIVCQDLIIDDFGFADHRGKDRFLDVGSTANIV